MIEHGLSFDVENWYDGNLFRHLYHGYADSRVERETERVLELLDLHGVTATFFTVGQVAARYPRLVRAMAAAGHEVACHGFHHDLVYQMTPQGFLNDLRRCRSLLQDLSGQSIQGFRAPSWSITSDVLSWAPAVIAAAGFTYSSSVFPFRTPLYGVAGAPVIPWKHALPGDGYLPELPPAVKGFGPVRIPFGGGLYWRLLPWGLTNRFQALSSQPLIFYLHPWELSADEVPLAKGMPLLSRVTLTYNRKRAEERFARMLQTVRFGPIAEVFASHVGEEESA